MANLIAPSILSADFAKLGEEIRDVQDAGADWLHVDIMDGHFVPNLTIGPPVVSRIKPIAKVPLDCHLMVTDPAQWIEPFAQAGADVITIHVETIRDAALLQKIRSLGKKAGLSLNPATPIAALKPYLAEVDLILVMSVNPGFGGQTFMEGTYKKLEELAPLQKSHRFLIEVDGGVSAKNAKALAQAGAQVFVAGNAIFARPDRQAALAEIRAQIS